MNESRLFKHRGTFHAVAWIGTCDSLALCARLWGSREPPIHPIRGPFSNWSCNINETTTWNWISLNLPNLYVTGWRLKRKYTNMCNKQNCIKLQLLDIIGYDRCTSSWHQNFDAFDSDKLVALSSVKLCQALSRSWWSGASVIIPASDMSRVLRLWHGRLNRLDLRRPGCEDLVKQTTSICFKVSSSPPGWSPPAIQTDKYRQ